MQMIGKYKYIYTFHIQTGSQMLLQIHHLEALEESHWLAEAALLFWCFRFWACFDTTWDSATVDILYYCVQMVGSWLIYEI